jgi:hypothetical protein
MRAGGRTPHLLHDINDNLPILFNHALNFD